MHNADVNVYWWSLTQSAKGLFVGGLEQGFVLQLLAKATKKANNVIITSRQEFLTPSSIYKQIQPLTVSAPCIIFSLCRRQSDLAAKFKSECSKYLF